MKISVLLLFISTFIFTSCGTSNVTKEKTIQSKLDSVKVISRAPAAIQVNQSTVTAIVTSTNIKSPEDFQIKANILKVENTPAFHSMAIVGADYNLTPNFQLDDNKQIMSSPKNEGLLSLTKLKAGDSFKAVIFYTQFKGWFIDRVISSPILK